jgi:hypothetical protein
MPRWFAFNVEFFERFACNDAIFPKP